jgi:ketosteroid isomerase-like protein
MMGDPEIRAELERHWAACDAGDQEAVHEIYHEDCVIEWPQSGERIRGRESIKALRESHPSQLGFETRRILGGGELWITEYVITYDGEPVHTVSIMEFRGGKVARETHYFADPFEPPEWRAAWVERTPPGS